MALNIRRNLLLLACCVVCSASEWARHNITVSILLIYSVNEMLKDSIFYRRAEHCLVDCVNSRYAATKIYRVKIFSELLSYLAL